MAFWMRTRLWTTWFTNLSIVKRLLNQTILCTILCIHSWVGLWCFTTTSYIPVVQAWFPIPADLYPGSHVQVNWAFTRSVISHVPWGPQGGGASPLTPHTTSSSWQPLSWFSPLELGPVYRSYSWKENIIVFNLFVWLSAVFDHLKVISQ